MMQIAKPFHTAAEAEAVRQVLMSGWTGPGPEVAAFEEEFSQFIGSPYAASVNSGTTALHLALLACGVKKGDEVLVPSLTFVSTVNAILYCGATPIFVDVDPWTLNARTADFEHAYTDKVTAMMVVHYGGRPGELSKLWDFAHRNGIMLIEDAAHACGSVYRDRRIGGTQYSDATCFSFDSIKNMTTGDGGMITTNRLVVDQRIREMRNLGIRKTTWNRMKGKEPIWSYSIEGLGYRAHMNDISAAIGRLQLVCLGERNARRRWLGKLYREGLKDQEWIQLPLCLPPQFLSAQFMFVIQLDDRDALYGYLKSAGIGSGVHYIPLHFQPFYRKFARESLPNTEEVWKRILTLPLYPQLKDDEIYEVIERIKEFGANGVRELETYTGNHADVEATKSDGTHTTRHLEKR